jgi:hypothetical protein
VFILRRTSMRVSKCQKFIVTATTIFYERIQILRSVYVLGLIAALVLMKRVKVSSLLNSFFSKYVISNVLISVRIIGLIDLFGVYTIYRELTFWSMYFLSFPFVISSIMLFLLHWHETMTSSSIVVHPFIVKMRIPFFVTSGVLLLLQIAVILTGVFNIRGFVDVTSKITIFGSRNDTFINFIF